MEREEIKRAISEKYGIINQFFDERTRRLWASAEAKALGYGGQSLVAEATGISRSTINIGLREIEEGVRAPGKRVRCPGGGRKRLTELNPQVKLDLENLVDPTTRGDPESPLRWTCKSTRVLSEALKKKGHKIGRQSVAYLLHDLGYSLQGNRKTKEGASHPDRDAQFRYINGQVLAFQQRKEPIVSVDTKKKERVGEFKNGGREWQPKGQPECVRTYDFADKELGKVCPYGVYDQRANLGWVSVGTDHDTAEFAVESIRRWWYKMGRKRYPHATELLITADCGGSNGYRVRLWKVGLQRLVDELELCISVCHFPPGTSKWNKIEHRMFSHISMNWRGKPLTSHEVIVNLISNTRTKEGLEIQAELDIGIYPKGIKVSDEELRKVNLKRAKFHGEWNYRIKPRIDGQPRKTS
jgi:transposase